MFTFSPIKLLFNHVLEVSSIAVVTPVLPVALEGAQFPEIHRELLTERGLRVTQTYTRANEVKKRTRRLQTSTQSDPDCVHESGVSDGVKPREYHQK